MPRILGPIKNIRENLSQLYFFSEIHEIEINSNSNQCSDVSWQPFYRCVYLNESLTKRAIFFLLITGALENLHSSTFACIFFVMRFKLIF